MEALAEFADLGFEAIALAREVVAHVAAVAMSASRSRTSDGFGIRIAW